MANLGFSPLTHIPHYSTLLLRALRTPLLVYFVLAGNLLTFSSAGAFTLFERGNNPRVHGYLDGLWWAMTTVTTVGYGDITPTTLGGRLVAVALMISGILFFVGFAAVLVSAIDTLAAEQVSEETAQDTKDTVLRELHQEMKDLKRELAELRDELRTRHKADPPR